jgi:6-phosphogluconolactonase (cycloisomerase 2 family)
MPRFSGSWGAALVWMATLAVMTSAYAGNRLQVVQTTDAPCSRYGGGREIAVSPDGAHVYEATDTYGWKVFVSSRSAATGGLTLVQTVEIPSYPYPNQEVRHMAVSPDGRNMYVLIGSSRLAVFARDTGSGALTLVDIVDLGSDARARFVAISPDGAHVYVAEEWTLTVFARESTTGTLSPPIEIYSVSPSSGEVGMVISPDSAHVYWSRGRRVATYRRDALTGTLILVGEVPASGRLAASADGQYVYVLQSPSDGPNEYSLRTFHRDAGTGLLTQIDVETNASLARARDLAVGPGGQQVYVVVSDSPGRVLVFDRDGGNGSLTFAEEHIDQANGVDGLKYPGRLAIPADGAHVYTIGPGTGFEGNGSGTVTFARDAVTGSLTFLREAEAEQAEDLVASPDGKHVYRLCSRRIATFDRDATSGLLTQSGTTDVGQNADAYEMTMSPDGEHIYVRSIQPAVVSVLQRNAVTGALASVTDYPASALNDATAFQFSPDGRNVYARRWSGDDGLVILTREPSTGLLAPSGSILSGEGGVPAGTLGVVTDIAVSPDGKSVYTSSYPFGEENRGGIAVFARDAGTGALTFADMALQTDPLGYYSFVGVDHLAISTDGRLVYATWARWACRNGDCGFFGELATYGRNPISGDLTRRSGVLREGTANAGTFLGVVELTVRPDGTTLYGRGNGLEIVRTDPTTGSLAYVERIAVDPYPREIRAYGDQGYALRWDGNVAVLGPRPVCAPTPATGCSGADASALRVVAKDGPSDTVVWKWAASGAISVGDPLTTTEYALCVYDSSILAQPVFSSSILPGRTCGTKPCWAATATGYKYADRAGIPDGINAVRVLGGASGSARIALKGKGAGLPELGLPYQNPVTAQLQASNGQCWEASYTTATSSPGGFKAAQ